MSGQTHGVIGTDKAAGLDFTIYLQPYGLKDWQVIPRLRTDAGLERDATPEEVKLYNALAAAQARAAELEAQADAEHETRRKKK